MYGIQSAQMAMLHEVEVALEARDELGEGPWWSVAEQALWRVDIQGRAVHRWSPETGDARRWRLPSEVGCAIPTADAARVIVGLRSGLAALDLESGSVTPLADPEPGLPGNRFNDGKCDRRGRLFAGTMDDAEQKPAGSLYRLDLDGSLSRVVEGVTVSNGLGWSPDDTTMYYTDSGARTIWAFDYDPASGEMSRRRDFARDDDCFPDGLTVDAEGFVWSAKWDGGRLVRYAPDGAVDRVIQMPVSRPTSVSFGGPELDRLYVTSARTGRSEAERSATPAGSVLVVEPGTRGVAEQPYGG